MLGVKCIIYRGKKMLYISAANQQHSYSTTVIIQVVFTHTTHPSVLVYVSIAFAYALFHRTYMTVKLQ